MTTRKQRKEFIEHREEYAATCMTEWFNEVNVALASMQTEICKYEMYWKEGEGNAVAWAVNALQQLPGQCRLDMAVSRTIDLMQLRGRLVELKEEHDGKDK